MEFPLTGTIKSILVVGAYTLIETWFLVTIILIYGLRNVLLNFVEYYCFRVVGVVVVVVIVVGVVVGVVGSFRWCLSVVITVFA